MLLALVLATAFQPSFDFYTYAPYEKAVPRPETILGYGPGERHTTYHDQERVINSIVAGAPARVKRVDFGKSTEGRALRILAISSPENMKRLDDILKQNQTIADAKQTTIPADLPAIVWINQCIHGNETASFESAMWLTYTLATSTNKAVTDILKNTVVVVNPSYNPDGHERFVVWYNSLSRSDQSDDAVEHQEQGVLGGRGNHYRFDLNRDRVAMSQVETQQEVAEFRKWNPHVYVDQHGQVETYFFPPVAQSIHKDIDRERYISLSTILGKETAKAFDEHGWRYYVREVFDFYGAIYLDTWASFNGAIGLTHETDGGRAIRRERDDESVVTLRDGMAKHFTSAMAVLKSASQYKTKFQQGFAKYKQDAVAGTTLGVTKRVLLKGDQRALRRLASLLDNQAIAYKLVVNRFEQRAKDYFGMGEEDVVVPAFSIVIDLAQPRGHLAKVLLESGQDFEPEFTERQMKIREGRKDKEQYPGRDGFEFYDTTGWSIPLAFGLDAYTAADTPPVEASGRPAEYPYASENRGGRVGWIIPYLDHEDAVAVTELLQADVRVHVATKSMKTGSDTTAAGTFFVFRDRNAEDIDGKVMEILRRHDCLAEPLNTSFPTEGVVGPGSESVVTLTKPEIAIVFGDQPSTSQFGSCWFVFDKVFKLPFTAISQRALAGDLSKYTAILMPAGARTTPQLKTWVQNGGVAIALGNSSVIGSDWIDLKESKLKDDKDPTELPGAIFKASLHPRSPLAYGYDPTKPIAVPLSGSTFYKRREEGGGVVLFGDAPQALSGWTWPDEMDALKDTVWLHDQPIGAGHVVWFAEDPTSRAMWPGTYKILLNAVLMGN
jgi:hypothetical protein